MNTLKTVAMGLVGFVSMFVVGCGSAPEPTPEGTGTESSAASNCPPGTGIGCTPGPIGGGGGSTSCKALSAGLVPSGAGFTCEAAVTYALGGGEYESSAQCQNNAALDEWMSTTGETSPWYASYGGSECNLSRPAPGYVWVSYDPTCPGCAK